MYGKGLRAVEQPESPAERRVKPQYFDEMMYVKSPFTTEKGKPLYTALDLPPLELNRLYEFKKTFLNMLTPIKVLVDVYVRNQKDFPVPGTPIKKYPHDMAMAPVWVRLLPQPVLDEMKKKGLIDQIHDVRSGKRILGVDRAFLHLAHTAFPFLSEMARMYTQPAVLTDERPETAKLRFMTGVGFAALDKQRERENQVWRERVLLDNLQRFLMQHGRMPEKDELKEMMPEGMKESRIIQ